MESGRQIRRQAKTRLAAEEILLGLERAAALAPGEKPVLTRIDRDIFKNCEIALGLLDHHFQNNGRNIIDVVLYYIANYHNCSTEHTFATATAIYLEAKRGKISVPQLNTIRTLLHRLAKSFPTEKLHTITKKELENWLFSANVGPKTFNNYLGDASAFFNWAIKQEKPWLKENPAGRIERRTVVKKIPEILTADVASRLMHHMEEIEGGQLSLLFALALFAGVRPSGELSRIAACIADPRTPPTTFKIDIENSLITLAASLTKTNKHRWIPIPPNLHAWIRAYPAEAKNADFKVFARFYPGIRKRFRIPLDGLRHSFISYAVKQHAKLEDVALWAGNSAAIIHEHYLNLGIPGEDVKKFWNIVPRRTP